MTQIYCGVCHYWGVVVLVVLISLFHSFNLLSTEPLFLVKLNSYTQNQECYHCYSFHGSHSAPRDTRDN